MSETHLVNDCCNNNSEDAPAGEHPSNSWERVPTTKARTFDWDYESICSRSTSNDGLSHPKRCHVRFNHLIETVTVCGHTEFVLLTKEVDECEYRCDFDFADDFAEDCECDYKDCEQESTCFETETESNAGLENNSYCCYETDSFDPCPSSFRKDISYREGSYDPRIGPHVADLLPIDVVLDSAARHATSRSMSVDRITLKVKNNPGESKRSTAEHNRNIDAPSPFTSLTDDQLPSNLEFEFPSHHIFQRWAPNNKSDKTNTCRNSNGNGNDRIPSSLLRIALRGSRGNKHILDQNHNCNNKHNNHNHETQRVRRTRPVCHDCAPTLPRRAIDLP